MDEPSVNKRKCGHYVLDIMSYCPVCSEVAALEREVEECKKVVANFQDSYVKDNQKIEQLEREIQQYEEVAGLNAIKYPNGRRLPDAELGQDQAFLAMKLGNLEREVAELKVKLDGYENVFAAIGSKDRDALLEIGNKLSSQAQQIAELREQNDGLIKAISCEGTDRKCGNPSKNQSCCYGCQVYYYRSRSEAQAQQIKELVDSNHNLKWIAFNYAQHNSSCPVFLDNMPEESCTCELSALLAQHHKQTEDKDES